MEFFVRKLAYKSCNFEIRSGIWRIFRYKKAENTCQWAEAGVLVINLLALFWSELSFPKYEL